MISNEIEFFAPESLDGCLQLLSDRGDDVTVMSGGMSLMPMMNLGLATPEIVLSLNHVSELAGIREDGDDLLIGGMTRHAQIATDPLVRKYAPALAQAASRIGDVQVRNRGTIGGSVSHADPSADYIPALAASGARMCLRSSSGGERQVTSQDFFIDLMFTDRQPEELVTAVRVPKLPAGWSSAYVRFARVEGSFAIANAAAVLAGDGSSATLALGGVSTRPVVLDITELGRGGWNDAALDAVGDAAFEAGADASGDAMSDAEYKREMGRVHARRVVRTAAAAFAGQGN